MHLLKRNWLNLPIVIMIIFSSPELKFVKNKINLLKIRWIFKISFFSITTTASSFTTKLRVREILARFARAYLSRIFLAADHYLPCSNTITCNKKNSCG